MTLRASLVGLLTLSITAAGCEPTTPRRSADAGLDGAAIDATTDAARDDAAMEDGAIPALDGGALDGGALDGGALDGGALDGGAAPLPYPTRSLYRIKGLQPDFWPNHDEVSGNNTGGVSMNLVWAAWEGSVHPPPCDAGQEAYDGHCYSVDANVDASIADYTARGLVVTAVVYGVPAWARAGRVCSPAAAGFEVFCAPNDAADYGRFAGMLANRYDGLHGHGRLADFVIHNEVNANDWFDIGCGQGVACDVDAWVRAYADSYNAAFDRIIAEQPFAKVLISFEHHFGSELDAPNTANPVLSVQTFLTRLASLIAPRAWRIAYHPYPPNLLRPEFSTDDWPRVTYGNIGALAGWLAATFPSVPSAREIQLTESGVNSLSPSSQAAQADGVCRSFRNVLGTPGIESYIYHRMRDHPVETAGGLGVGLHDDTGAPKAAWAVWALANRSDTTPPMLSCGFEELPYTRLSRSYLASRGHWASSRLPPPGFTVEQSWHLLHDSAPGTEMLYECQAGGHNLISRSAGCEGLRPLGPVGYAYTAAAAGRIALYRCYVPASGDHFVSASASCEGQTMEQLLGYALP